MNKLLSIVRTAYVKQFYGGVMLDIENQYYISD